MKKNLNFKKNWDKSYNRLENYLFYPNEELVKFVNRYVDRRKTLKVKKKNLTFLDVGCGAGRNLKFLLENGFKVIGVDLSKIAINQSKKLLKFYGFDKSRYKLLNSTSEYLNFQENSIDYVISDCALDSMSNSEFLKTIEIIYKILKPKGLFYLNLINIKKIIQSGKLLNRYDLLISSKHENQTIQSYFDLKRINKSFKKFKFLDIYEIIIKSKKKIIYSRYHLILKKK